MMHKTTSTLRLGFAGLFVSCAILLTGSLVKVAAQETQEAQDAQSTKPAASKRSYNTGRDPFRKYEPPRAVPKKLIGQVLPPSIQERIAQYKAQKAAAINARMQAPKPTTALLLSELQVVGISRTPRGYAAIVEATPIKLSYVIYPGEFFYDGQLVAIEDTRLVFRHDTVFTDGRRERSVELKGLRQPNTVSAMATSAPVASSEKP